MTEQPPPHSSLRSSPQLSGGITLLGAEMLTWSDLAGETGGFGGVVAPHLLSDFGGRRGRVLVVGPTTPEVVAGVTRAFERADVLTRSWLDAQTLRAALPEEVAVLCGPLDRTPAPEGGYDAVVAVAGIDRLHSAEEPTPRWQEVIGHLGRLLGEQGELYVGLGNPVGVDRLLALDPTLRHRDDAWPQGHAPVPEPRDSAEVLAHLAAEHGLAEVETWVCHGARKAPGVATRRHLLTERRDDPVVQRAVASAYSRQGEGAVRDPGRSAADLVASGLGAVTAPLSVLHLRRGGGRGGGGAGLGSVVLVEDDAVPGAPLACLLELGDDGWHRTVLGDAAVRDVAPGLVREPERLTGPLGEGESLAAAMAALLAEHDVSGVGVLVRALRDWLGEDGASAVDPRRVPVALDRVLVTGSGLASLDDSLVAREPAERDIVLVRALLRFSHQLLASGGRQPYSEAATPRTLTRSLVAAAGLEVSPAIHERAVALDAVLRPPSDQAPDFEGAAGGAAGLAAMSHAALVEVAEGLALRAAQQDAHVVWLLDNIQRRQRRLRKARANMRALEESREYRFGRRIFWLRDARRRRAEAREAAERPAGVWRDRSAEEEPVRTTVYVEEDLVPPGYEPHDGVTITPTGVDPEALLED